MQLDMSTAVLFSAIVGLVNALAMTLLALRDRTPYLRDWAIAFSLIAVGVVLFGLRGIVPPALAIVVGSTAAALGGAAIVIGIGRFTQQPVPWLALGVLLGLALSAVAAYSSDADASGHLAQRVVVLSLLIAALSAPCAWLIARHARREGALLSALALSAHLLLVALALLRAVVNLVAPVEGGFGGHLTREVLLVMALAVAHMLQGYGLISLHVGRLLQRVADQANTDALTELPNRRAFEHAWRRMVQRAQYDGAPLALVVMDIDHFKRVNDTHGHAAGDDALRALGWALRNHLRPGDLCARLGGEEFVLAMPGATPEVAQARAQDLLRIPLTYGMDGTGQAQSLTLSAGLTHWRASDATPFATIERADAALYVAKRDGRARVSVAP
jgi:diguanylate cyclase (GGDEF)-like protein